MKKVLFLTFFAAITCFVITGCKKPDSLCPCGKIEISKKEYVAMCVLPNVVTANSVNTLRMENYTKKKMVYGPTADLEYFDETNWIPIRSLGIGGVVGTYIGLILFANEPREYTLNLYHLIQEYNDSKTGKYRIVRNIGDYDLYAEFEFK